MVWRLPASQWQLAAAIRVMKREGKQASRLTVPSESSIDDYPVTLDGCADPVRCTLRPYQATVGEAGMPCYATAYLGPTG